MHQVARGQHDATLGFENQKFTYRKTKQRYGIENSRQKEGASDYVLELSEVHELKNLIRRQA